MAGALVFTIVNEIEFWQHCFQLGCVIQKEVLGSEQSDESARPLMASTRMPFEGSSNSLRSRYLGLAESSSSQKLLEAVRKELSFDVHNTGVFSTCPFTATDLTVARIQVRSPRHTCTTDDPLVLSEENINARNLP
jgi:hypothetical protein